MENDFTIRMQYLGVLGLLSQCSVQVDEETREIIEAAFMDAEKVLPVKWKRTLDLIEIEVKG